jgi:hypothetical protein
MPKHIKPFYVERSFLDRPQQQQRGKKQKVNYLHQVEPIRGTEGVILKRISLNLRQSLFSSKTRPFKTSLIFKSRPAETKSA